NSGKLEGTPLPQDTALFGWWRLVDGKLQLTTFANPYRNLNGFRWDGARFQPVAPQAKSLQSAPGTSKNLSEDGADPEAGDRGANFLEQSQRKAFKDAGWHYKLITGYTGYEAEGGAATLPIALGHSKFDLNLHTTNWQNSSGTSFDYLA